MLVFNIFCHAWLLPLVRDIKGVDLEGKGTGEEKGGEIIVRIYSLKKEPIFNKMEKNLCCLMFSAPFAMTLPT